MALNHKGLSSGTLCQIVWLKVIKVCLKFWSSFN